MKFLGKWMKLENIILSELTQSQKNTHGMHSLISGYQPRSLEYPRYNSQTTWSSEEGRPQCEYFSPSKNQRSKHPWKEIQRQSLEQRLKERPLVTVPPQTLLWMPTSTYWPELDIAVSWEALPVLDKYRSGCSQPFIGQSPNEGARESTQEAEGVSRNKNLT